MRDGFAPADPKNRKELSMSKSANRKAAPVAAALSLLLLVLASTYDAKAAGPQTPWRNLTLDKLAAVWWQWTFSLQVAKSPQFDHTGANAYNGQPYADTGLLFLAGTFTSSNNNGDVLGQETRTISVKQGVALFFRCSTTNGTTPAARSIWAPRSIWTARVFPGSHIYLDFRSCKHTGNGSDRHCPGTDSTGYSNSRRCELQRVWASNQPGL